MGEIVFRLVGLFLAFVAGASLTAFSSENTGGRIVLAGLGGILLLTAVLFVLPAGKNKTGE